MTERLTMLHEPDGPEAPIDEPSEPGGLLERLERATMLTLARMGDSRVVVPLASAGLRTEVEARRLLDRCSTALWHAYQLPTRHEVMALSEQVSALRFRVAELEKSRAPKARR